MISHNQVPINLIIKFRNQNISMTKKSYRWLVLGIVIDEKLTFKNHIEQYLSL